MQKIISLIFNLIVILLVATILAISVRGNYGNPKSDQLTSSFWRVDGPFELSPERGRFGLLYSLIEDKSFFFSTDLARFIVPDLGYINGNYVSLFAPAVSFIAMPGYILGSYYGASQVGSYLTISLFALINLFLILKIVKKLTSNYSAGLIAGLLYLFATPAYAYAVNLYQHHISTFLILLSVFILMSTRKVWPLIFVWFLCAMSIPVDYPNLILMFPIGLFSFLRIFSLFQKSNKFKIKINLFGILTFFGLVLPILFFGWFNQNSYNNPLQFSGTVESARAIDENGQPTNPNGFDFESIDVDTNNNDEEKSATGFFNSRSMINGLYIHLLSPDRGIIYFTPVVLFGLFGIFILHKQKNKYLPMLLGVVFANVVLYSMWGDPWGGWAFGSRYLIPAYAIMAIFIGVALSEFRRKWLFLILFYPVLVYSILVNSLGALTTSANPPQVQVLLLEAHSGRQERYSVDRNWEFLNSGKSKSFVFQTWASKYVDSVNYYYIVSGTIILLTTALFIYLIFKKENKV